MPSLLHQRLIVEYLATLPMVELLGVLATLPMVELLGVLATLPMVELLGVTDWKRDSGWKAIRVGKATIANGINELNVPLMLPAN